MGSYKKKSILSFPVWGITAVGYLVGYVNCENAGGGGLKKAKELNILNLS